MILESIDEIKAQGVTVKDYRTQEEKAQPLDVSQEQQTWCDQCNLPDDICRGHDVTPSPTVETIVILWSQLSADDIGTLARQLARADAGKANLFAEALWSEAMDSERHARIWDSIEAQLRVAQ